MPKNIIYVTANDFAAVYIDGILWKEGHSFDTFKEGAECIVMHQPVGSFVTHLADVDWFEERGCKFPRIFDDAVLQPLVAA